MKGKGIQRQDIFQYAKESFGTEPEYPWQTYPDYAVLRNARNGKWYAILMEVPKEKLKLEGTEPIDVMNVKCDPVMIGSLLQNKGYLPAYHMNKEKWISILLDGTVPAEDIFWLLNLSHETVAQKEKRSGAKQRLRGNF